MKKRSVLFFFFISFFLPLCPHSTFAQDVKIIAIDDHIISPVTVDYIKRALIEAVGTDSILLIKLDTPGGLLKSTQEIVKLLLNSSVPVVTYITPSGAKAASAGVFISYASHLLIMSPSTHIGAAHPVISGGSWGKLDEEIKTKVMNDTLVWAENIAQKRNRPVSFIRDAIQKSSSITEKEALKKKVCDGIASNLDEALRLINSKTVTVLGEKTVLATDDALVEEIPLTVREKVFNTIIDPNIAYILLTLGMLGLIFEVTHPGFGFPGIAASICLILAFYALSVLPLNYAGLILVILGIVFLIVENFTPTFGMFTLGGVTALVFGSLMLFNQPQFIQVSFKVFIPIIVFLTGMTVFILGKILSVHRTKSKVGKEGLLNETGIAQTNIDTKGKVSVHGELWNAVSTEKIKKGQEVVIIKVERLTLFVKRKEA